MAVKNLSRKQFDILSALAQAKENLSQRALAELAGISPASVNRCLKELSDLGYANGEGILPQGYEALEPYRVKRAVIFAAGFGARLMPLSLNIPKPLIRIKSLRIIDTLIDALLHVGIRDITIVRGHLGEQFDSLLYKYPMLKFLDNPHFMDSENIVSALCAGESLSNAYILEGDLYLHKQELIRPYEYSSNYLAVPVETTHDWCFQVKNRYISSVSVGGRDCYHMYGISYWTEEDGLQLKQDLETVCNSPGGTQRFWDLVPLEYCSKNYKVEIRPCKLEDVSEVDSLKDLRKLDCNYGEELL